MRSMNPAAPVDQNTIPIYIGPYAELRARLLRFRNARATLRRWTLPQYARRTDFQTYETQMKLIFQDAEVSDVVLGRAIRTVPVDGEPPGVTINREIYDECNLQAFSLIYRSFSGDKAGTVDARGAPHNDGHALWTKLVRFNYQINADSIPFLNQEFFNPMTFRQTKDMTLDVWANEVLLVTHILISDGNAISEREKTSVSTGPHP